MKRDSVNVAIGGLMHRLEPGIFVELAGSIYVVESVDPAASVAVLRPIGRTRVRRWLRRLSHKARGVARAALATVTEKGG